MVIYNLMTGLHLSDESVLVVLVMIASTAAGQADSGF